MVFSQTTISKQNMGSRKMHMGTYTGTAVTTGELATGLRLNEIVILQPAGSAVATNASVINETFPNSLAQTIIFDSGQSGTWIAIGR